MGVGQEIHHAKQHGSHNHTKRQTNKHFVQTEKRQCVYCGTEHTREKEHCPAYREREKKGKKCNSINHFVNVCRKGGKTVNFVDHDFAHDDNNHVLHVDDDHVLHAGDSSNMGKKGAYAKVLIRDKEITFQPDSGATTNCMNHTTYVRVTGDKRGQELKPSNRKLIMYYGSEVRPTGGRIMKVTNPKIQKEYKVRFQIVKGNSRPILGLRAVEYMELMTVRTENIADVPD